MSAKYNAFGLSGLKKNWSIIPLLGFIGAGVGGAASYVVYMLVTKQDYRFRRWSPMEASYTAKPDEVRKIYVSRDFSTRVKNMNVYPEVEALKKEIYSEYHK